MIRVPSIRVNLAVLNLVSIFHTVVSITLSSFNVVSKPQFSIKIAHWGLCKTDLGTVLY